MTRHIVMFKFRENVPAEIRQAAAKEFKQGIEALPAAIPFIREITVGINVNPTELWDICLYSVFDSLDDIRAYSAHPAHKAMASALMRYIAERACTDF